jgi:hypothetical protein
MYIDDIADIVRVAAAGDEQAWATLVREYRPLIRSRTRGFRLNSADTADVEQTVWLRLAENITSLRDPTKIGGSNTHQRDSSTEGTKMCQYPGRLSSPVNWPLTRAGTQTRPVRRPHRLRRPSAGLSAGTLTGRIETGWFR